MSSAPFGFGFGARYMLDQTMTFTGEGNPVFLRMQNVDESQSDFADIGLVVSVSGSASGLAGFTDYQILPQPLVETTPNKRAGVPETQLQVGNTKLVISHTWVLQQMAKFGFTNPLAVFRDRRVMGIVTEGELNTIESINPKHAGGQFTHWEIVIVNADLNVTG